MEGESEPKFQSLKALRRRERDLVLKTSRHETRMLNINRVVLMVQTKELWSLMCLKETLSPTDEAEGASCLQHMTQNHTV